MRIAIVSNPCHRQGDMIEFLLLRAVHAFQKIEPADLLIVEGELGDADDGFLDALFKSIERRQLPLTPIWLARNGNPNLPEAPERINVNGIEESPASLVERIRVAVGSFPEFRKAPFEVTLAELAADGSVRARRIPMAVEKVPGVTDFHVHTRLAYCSENMNIPQALEMAKLSNIEQLAFVEHSGQLYFSGDDYWSGRYVWRTRGTAEGCPEFRRIDQYEEMIREGEAHAKFLHGFELDVDRNGSVALSRRDYHLAQVRLGACHHMAEKYDPHIVARQFMFCTEALLNFGVHVLAHPFRIFPWSGQAKPTELYEPVAELLRCSGTAVEMNFHQNDPEPEFFELCLKKGVKIALSSDSHNLYEVGFFLPHFRMLAELDVMGRLDEVLYQFSEHKE